MKISIVGSGYVGLVTGACFAELGHEVTFADIDEVKLKLIDAAQSPICEPGLEDLLADYTFTTTINTAHAVKTTDVTFICVGTPQSENGSQDLQYIKSAAMAIGKGIGAKSSRHVVIVKSTVVPGTTEDVVIPIIEQHSGKKAYVDFGIGSNPEFLREGNALFDFMHTDRVVIGTQDVLTQNVLKYLYMPLHTPIVSVNIKTAEMIKYVSNAFLAMKISFSNEIGNLCKKVGIDSYEVFKGVGLDSRIGPYFFNSGIGFGGSCFTKDVRALICYADEHHEYLSLLDDTLDINNKQPNKMIRLLKKHLPIIRGSTIGVLGLSFKPDTDDVRESRAIPIIQSLVWEGTNVIVHDPIAMKNFKIMSEFESQKGDAIFSLINYAEDSTEVLNKADVVLIVTDWADYSLLDYAGKIVIDGRRVEQARKTAKVYEGVCW